MIVVTKSLLILKMTKKIPNNNKKKIPKDDAQMDNEMENLDVEVRSTRPEDNIEIGTEASSNEIDNKDRNPGLERNDSM